MRRRSAAWTVPVLLFLARVAPGQILYHVYGLDFGPYALPNETLGSTVTPAQIATLLQTIAPYTEWVRTYSSTNGLQNVCPIAHTLGLKCAAGAWINGVTTGPITDQTEVNALITLVQNGDADLAVVGTEVLFRFDNGSGGVNSATLSGYISQVRAAAQQQNPVIPVTTADTYGELLNNLGTLSPLIDLVFVNVYPMYQDIPLEDSISWINAWYQLLTSAYGKTVLLSETGWATAGDAFGLAIPSPVNSAMYLVDFVSWARANSVGYFLFEAFDEPSKAVGDSAGEQAHFGLWNLDSSGNPQLKPGMQAIFNGTTIPDNWTGADGTGSPQITVTHVPLYGTSASDPTSYFSGRVLGAIPGLNKIACLIEVGGEWYPKPYGAQPLTPILSDGSWSCNPATPGVTSDVGATQLGAFLLPNGVSTLAVGGNPPATLTSSVLAFAIVDRTPIGISGTIVDINGSGMPGVTVTLSGTENKMTTTDQYGNYSFVDLASGGTYSVTASAAGAAFTPASIPDANAAGPMTGANFSATAQPFTVSGQITDAYGDAVANAPLSISGASIASTNADVFGNYAFGGLAPGLNYTVASSAPGYSFTPSSASFTGLSNNQTANFSGLPNLTQTLNFAAPSAQTIGVIPPPLAATDSADLPVTFTSGTPSVCSTSGPVFTVTGAGICTIIASQSGSGPYLPASPVTQSFTITGMSQTITFAPLGNVAVATGPFTLSATASSGMMVSFASSTPSVCSVSDTTVTIVAAGGCSITASQAGNATFAPATTTQSFTVLFADVASTDYDYAAVNAMARYGITAGCGNNDFCPNEDVTRDQMAIFIVRAIYGSDNFTYTTTPYFTDVTPTTFGFKWIQKLKDLGVTAGCTATAYCPTEVVTRDEMAIFIIRARLGVSIAGGSPTFTYPSTPYFTDTTVSTDFAFPWIQRLKLDNITAGCTTTTYCPTDPVTRGEMAIFIMRGAFNQFLPAGTPVISSIGPSTLPVGTSGTYTITGTNTNFVQGTTQLSPIPGVTISAITVNSGTSMTVQLTAASNAGAQPYSILAITGTEQDVLPNGLILQ
jgi:exo-beta-1,3-glucanase (GH17 family)